MGAHHEEDLLRAGDDQTGQGSFEPDGLFSSSAGTFSARERAFNKSSNVRASHASFPQNETYGYPSRRKSGGKFGSSCLSQLSRSASRARDARGGCALKNVF